MLSAYEATMWHCIYTLPWTKMEVERITLAARDVAVELLAQVQVDSESSDRVEIYFTVPVLVLEQRESTAFTGEVKRQDLNHAISLTLEAEVRETNSSTKPYQLFVSSENGSNDLCDRTAMFLGERLADYLGATKPGNAV